MATSTRRRTAYETGQLLDEFISKAERRIGASFLDVIAGLKAAYTLEALATFIEAGQIEAALAVVETYAGGLASTVSRVYVDAGQEVIDALGDRLGVVVNFDQTNVRAVNWMRENRLGLVREFTQEQAAVTRQALVRGITEGLNPIDQARAFRDSIGLTRRQLEWIDNYRRELETLSPRALGRQLRDRRFDRRILDAIDHETPLGRDQIERMVGRYRERWIKYRAETIARNEALEAAHAASHEAVLQGIESGSIDPEKATQTWNTSRDERVRESHQAMHLQVRRIDEPFESGAGNLIRYPGDSAAPPEDTIECRCRVSTRVSL